MRGFEKLYFSGHLDSALEGQVPGKKLWVLKVPMRHPSCSQVQAGKEGVAVHRWGAHVFNSKPPL